MGRTVSHSRSGLTLAETLVSLTILTLVMLAVLNLFPSAMSNARLTRNEWLARQAAQCKIEALAASPFGSLEVGTEQEDEVPLPDGAKASLRTTVSAVNGHPDKLIKCLRCEVSWPGRATTKTAVEEVYVHALRR